MDKKIPLTLLLFALLYFGIGVLLPTAPFGLRRNVTESLPTKFFLKTPLQKVTRGEFVELSHPESSALLAKQVIGVAGDLIAVKEGEFFINDEKKGTILKKLLPVEEGTIPADHVFVYASHPESFDSRYQRFGLVHIDQLEGRLWPLF